MDASLRVFSAKAARSAIVMFAAGLADIAPASNAPNASPDEFADVVDGLGDGAVDFGTVDVDRELDVDEPADDSMENAS